MCVSNVFDSKPDCNRYLCYMYRFPYYMYRFPYYNVYVQGPVVHIVLYIFNKEDYYNIHVIYTQTVIMT